MFFWTNGPSIAIFVIHVIVKDISKVALFLDAGQISDQS